jgi:peptide/nickel transport system permease protein
MAQIATTSETVAAPVADRPVGTRGGAVIQHILHNKAGTAGFIIFVGFVLLAIFGPLLVAPETSANVAQIYSPPSSQHWLGTDYAGHDVFKQLVRGGRSIMIVGALAALLSTMFAVTFGALAAFLGGGFDSFILMITDVVLTIPYIILLGVLAAFIKLSSPYLLALIIASVAWPTLLRAVRAQVLSLKEREYIEAARVLDLGTPYILFREVVPNMMSYIVISFIIAMTAAIYGQIILYFLGLVPLAGDNWGLMINLAYTRGALFNSKSLWYILSPIVAISLLQLSLVMMTRSLEDVFNPRLREG